MDVLQSTLRCNADYQYQKRAVPDLKGTRLLSFATEQGQSCNAREQRRTQSPFLCGCSALMTDTGKLIMNTLGTAMRAANVADFYMTKYLSLIHI